MNLAKAENIKPNFKKKTLAKIISSIPRNLSVGFYCTSCESGKDSFYVNLKKEFIC